MKDPFPPARAAGCRAMVENIDSYEPRDISARVLPAICGLLVDPEKTVREAGFKAVSKFVGHLEDISNNPEKSEKLNPSAKTSNTPSSTSATSASSGSQAPQGWAGYLTSAALNATVAAASAAASTASSKFRKTSSPDNPETPDADIPQVVVQKEEKTNGATEAPVKKGGMQLKSQKGKVDDINWDAIEAETVKESSDTGNGWGKGVKMHESLSTQLEMPEFFRNSWCIFACKIIRSSSVPFYS